MTMENILVSGVGLAAIAGAVPASAQYNPASPPAPRLSSRRSNAPPRSRPG
jgi:hypothetical protein